MGKAPVPCTNCLRFHYGGCKEEAKDCHECGGLNHLERYCPSRRRVIVPNGEPLPGTVSWCRMWELEGEIRDKVSEYSVVMEIAS